MEFTHEDAILDLLLSDCCDSITNVSVSDPFSSSDHSMIWFDLLFSQKCNSATPTFPEYKFDFASADWALINQTLASVNWLHLIHNLPIDKAWDSFYSVIHNIIICHVPAKLVKKNRAKYVIPKKLKNFVKLS